MFKIIKKYKCRLKYKNNIYIIKYIIIASIATIFDVGLLYILTHFIGIKYLISSVISYCIGMAINYSLNKFLNFKDNDKRIALQFGVFVAVALVGLALNQIIIIFLVELFDMWYINAKIFSLLIVVFWSFWGHKNITFQTHKNYFSKNVKKQY